MAHGTSGPQLPIISDPSRFDRNSGSWLERLVFNNRMVIIVSCLLVTIFLGWAVQSRLVLQAGFEKMLPSKHPYVLNYRENKEDLSSLGNTLTLAVSTSDDTIYTPEFMKILEDVTNEVFFVAGVDRTRMKSIFTPNTRWRIVTEEGFEGGPIIPSGYDGSPESIEQVRQNVTRGDLVGRLVANNARSAAISIPLMDFDPETGEKLDYHQFSSKLETIRSRFQRQLEEKLQDRVEGSEQVAHKVTATLEGDVRNEFETGGISIHITGFAKIVGALIDGLFSVMTFFAMAVVIAFILLFLYTRCVRSTFIVIAVTIIAVVWQLGILALAGFELDPFSILVPFLIFAIGVSHGAQKLNGVLRDIGNGCHPYVAARYTFRRLFLAGVTALLSDGVGFAVLMIIMIPVIQDLAITASIGVTVLIFTNLILIPVLLSYFGVGKKAAERSARSMEGGESLHPTFRFLLKFTERRWATIAVAAAVVLAVAGFYVSRDLQIGDLDKGASELRPDSRYNQDVDFMIDNYSVSSDIFAIIVKLPKDGCIDYESLELADELEWRLKQNPAVEAVVGMNTNLRQILAGMSEGYIKWQTLYPNQDTINYAAGQLINENQVNTECSLWPLLVYLSDHKAATLTGIVEILEQFNQDWPSSKAQFLGAAGNAGFEAATNIVVKKANREMLFYVYAAVIALCFLTFRSVAGVICAVLPLMLTSILCEALMVKLGIGVKVATLPVIALGVGIGVDYALYVLTVILAKTREGETLHDAYFHTLCFTGRVVALIGVTLAAGVVTWAWSPIKFQADMGILLTFMFLWNMVGALVLMPALAHFLLPKRKPGDEEEEVPAAIAEAASI